MPLFHFHLRSREGVERDGSGVEFADAESAYLDAFETARTMWGEMLGRREDPTAYTFEITDEEDHLVLELPFSEVLDATRRNRRAPKPAAAGAARKCAARTLALVTALREQIELSRIAVKQARELLDGAPDSKHVARKP